MELWGRSISTNGFIVWEKQARQTSLFQVAIEPKQAHNDYNNVDKYQVREHGHKVQVQLLVDPQFLEVDTRGGLVLASPSATVEEGVDG